MRTMRKADVTFHRENGRARPAVNVKVYNARNVTLPREEFDGMTWEWIDAQSQDAQYASWDGACEDGWRQIQEHAREIWGPQAKVYSEGRSGGWAIVDNVYAAHWDDLASWDALALSRWARFVKRCAEVVADTGYRYVFNMWTRYSDAAEEQADELERDTLAGPATHREGSAAQ
jgi:hypothetical protein